MGESFKMGLSKGIEMRNLGGLLAGALALALGLFTVPGGVALGDDNTTWSQLVNRVASLNSGSEENISIDGAITAIEGQPLVVPAGASLTLSGKGEVSGPGGDTIKVEAGAHLRLAGPSFSKARISVEGGALDFVDGSIHDTKMTGPIIFVKDGTFKMGGTADFSRNDVTNVSGALPEGVKEHLYAPITVYNGKGVSITGGTVTHNHGYQRGGAIGIWGSPDAPTPVVLTGGEISGNDAIHPRWNGYGGGVYATEANVTLDGATMAGNTAENGGGLAIEGGESFSLKSGLVKENTNGKYDGRGGGVYVSNVKAVDISGGAIEKNTANGHGGGILVMGGKNVTSDVAISGGSISLNTTVGNAGYGGGAYIQKANVTIKDGKFAENNAATGGGGIGIRASKASISGGEFAGNTAGLSGGGLYLSGESSATMTAANIHDNTSKGFWGGGGIFIEKDSSLNVHNALIRGNTIKDVILVGAGSAIRVSPQGGGVWNCPTGQTTLKITKGVAIFDNSAPDAGREKQYKGAGDDFVGIAAHQFEEAVPANPGQPVSISERMLGGGERIWYQDGSVYNIHKNWLPGKQLPRYVPGAENTRIEYDTEYKVNRAFKSVPSEESKQLAERLATVRIENNYATRTGISGAGIANNGHLTFGEDGWKLKITKSWEDDDPGARPASITVDVLVGGVTVVRGVELTKANNWETVIENFPNPETLIDAKTGERLPLEFKESGADGYSMEVAERPMASELTYAVTLTNRLVTSVDVSKQWLDSDGTALVAGDQPQKVEVELLADGAPTGQKLQLVARNSWAGTFTDLPKYKDGKLINYAVREVAVPGFTSEVTGTPAGGFTVVNTKIPPEKTQVQVLKKWLDYDGSVLASALPESVDVELLADGVATGQKITLTKENSWVGTFKDLPKYKDDGSTLIKYTVKESPVPGFVTAVAGSSGQGFTVTNTRETPPPPKVTELLVQKQWVDSDGDVVDRNLPRAIELQLVRVAAGENIPVGDPVEVTPDSEGRWQYLFTDLPIEVNGETAVYSVVESPVDGFTASVGEIIDGKVTLTNKQNTPPPSTPQTTPPTVSPTTSPSKPPLVPTGAQVGGLLAAGAVMALLGVAIVRRRGDS